MSEVEFIEVIFVEKDGNERKIKAAIGSTLLQVAHDNEIDLEGACEGSLACSTCHVIVDPDWFEKYLSETSEEEDDMLDLAFGLTATSRLGCQIVLSKKLDGLRIRLPAATRNISNQ